MPELPNDPLPLPQKTAIASALTHNTTDVTDTLAGLAKAVSATNKGSCGATETYRSSSLVPHKVSREVSRYPADPFDPNYVDIDTGNMRCAVAQVGPKQAAADLADMTCDMTPEERLQRERRDERNRKERERRAHRKIEKQRLTKEAELAQNAAPPAGPQGGLQPGARVCEGEQRNGTELLRDEKGKFVGSNDESS